MSEFDFRCKYCKGRYDSIEDWENNSEGCSDCDFIYTGSLQAKIDKYRNLHSLAKGRLNKAHEYTEKLEARIIKLEVAMHSIIGLVNYPDEVSKTAKDVMGITKTTPQILKEN